jgi:hypothetical protein
MAQKLSLVRVSGNKYINMYIKKMSKKDGKRAKSAKQKREDKMIEDVVDQVDAQDLCVSNALTWKQFLNSGNKVGLVFTADTRDYNFSPIGPFGKKRQKRTGRVKMSAKHRCKSAHPGKCKLRHRKMFYPLKYLDLIKNAKEEADPSHIFQSHEFMVKRQINLKGDKSRKNVFVSISNDIFTKLSLVQIK